MKSLALKLTLILSSIFFTACSSMQIGFEEDSPFYTAPSEKKSQVRTEAFEVETPKAKEVKEEKVVVVKPAQEEQVNAPKAVKEKEAPDEEESETTFSYSREDGE